MKKAKVILIIYIMLIMVLGMISTPTKSNAASTYYQYVKSGINAFPESYQSKLMQLSSKYPSWKFQAYYTGIDWNELIEKERDDSVYRNRVTVSAPASWKHCNFVDDGWACASDSAVKYYLDPRNFLNETQIFQFVESSYNEKVQTLSAIQNSVKDTFLDNTVTCEDFNGNTITMSYSQMIIEAAKKTNISAFYIKSKIIQEVGVNGSGSVSGRYPGYEGLYNFYNYGANDEGDDIANGLAFADGKGWNSQYKAIVGGAELIGKYYINSGQNTAYFNKWDVVGTKILKDGESQTVKESDMFWHQYMTNIQDPNSQSYSNKKLYANSLDSEITFIIPVYNNMPAFNLMPEDVYVSGITLNKSKFIININEKGNVIANTIPSNATVKDIIWTVSDPEVVRVYNGDFRGLKEGTATITATTLDGGYTASCTIYVRNPNKKYVENIQIEKDLYIVKEDEAVDVQFTCTPVDSVNAELEWYSTDQEILRVYGPRFRGLKEGEAEIVAKTVDGTVETRSRIIVRNPNKSYVEKIEFKEKEYNVAVNEAIDIEYTYSPLDSINAEFVWESSNPEILRAWGPRFRALKEGNAEFIGRTVDGTVEARVKVNVKYANLQNISMENQRYIVDIDEAGQIKVNFEPINASNQTLYWETSDSETVRIYNGDFRGLKEGTATIAAISEEGGKVATCEVIVRDPNKNYVEKINLSQYEYDISVNEAVDVSFICTPENSVNEELYWESSNPEILRVYGPRFRGLQEGTAEIIGRTVDGTVETRAKVIVKNKKVESISTQKSTYTVDINEAGKIKVNFNPINATNQVLYWESSNPDIVRVYNGDFRGLKEGKSTITITSEDGGKIATCEVIVKDSSKKYVETINLTQTEYTVEIDEAVDLTFSYSPDDSINAEFVWESSNPDILRVWGPRFRTLQTGTAEVIVRTVDGTVESRITVNIK